MVEYVFKKPYQCELGTIAEGRSIRIATYDGKEYLYMDGGMLETSYNDILLNLIKNSKLRSEYLEERTILENKV